MNQLELNKPNNYPRIVVGTSDFKKLCLGSDIIVDKSLLIKAVLESEDEVLLITRPRRWGKSLNSSMLKYFFEIETNVRGEPLSPNERSNTKLFTNLGINDEQKSMEEQGKHPVIFFSLKNTKGNNYQEVVNKVRIQILEAFVKHRYLRKYLIPDNDFLEESEKKRLSRYLNGNIDETDLQFGLRFLSELLHKHFQKEVFILIDEYDETINDAYIKFGCESEEFKKISELIREILSTVLKDVTYLKKAVLTGIYRIAKANIFSGLNNVEEYTLLDPEFSEFYGFTQEEVDILLSKKLPQATPEKIKEIKDWYNGYNFGEQTVYNSLSIMRCLSRKGKIDTYWMNTGSTALIEQTLLSDDIQQDLQTLLIGQSITKELYKEIAFEQIKKETREEKKKLFYSLLVFAGYLSPHLANNDPEEPKYTLTIPNQEIRTIYNQKVKQWIVNKLKISISDYEDFVGSLLEENLEEFAVKANDYLIEASSYYDLQKEEGCHGLMIGLLAPLSGKYFVNSNKESGDGRYDHILIPKTNNPSHLAFILEYKVCKEGQQVEVVATKGLDQIDKNRYDTQVKRNPQVQEIMKICLVFQERKITPKYKKEKVNLT